METEKSRTRDMNSEDIIGFIQKEKQDYVPLTKQKETDAIEAEGLFKDLQINKLDSITEVIEEIKLMIQEREQLKNEIFKDLDKIGMKISNFLSEKKEDISIEEMIELQRKSIEVEENKAREKLNAWRDIANLKKELREHLTDLKEKKDSMDVFENMVGL